MGGQYQTHRVHLLWPLFHFAGGFVDHRFDDSCVRTADHSTFGLFWSKGIVLQRPVQNDCVVLYRRPLLVAIPGAFRFRPHFVVRGIEPSLRPEVRLAHEGGKSLPLRVHSLRSATPRPRHSAQIRRPIARGRARKLRDIAQCRFEMLMAVYKPSRRDPCLKLHRKQSRPQSTTDASNSSDEPRAIETNGA
jgi:hypothetical protein